MFHWEHWGFRLETGYDLHTFFQNLRNNEKKRKAQIVSGSKRKKPRVFRHSNIKVNSLTTLVDAPANRITRLVLIKEICKIRLFFKWGILIFSFYNRPTRRKYDFSGFWKIMFKWRYSRK